MSTDTAHVYGVAFFSENGRVAQTPYRFTRDEAILFARAGGEHVDRGNFYDEWVDGAMFRTNMEECEAWGETPVRADVERGDPYFDDFEAWPWNEAEA